MSPTFVEALTTRTLTLSPFENTVVKFIRTEIEMKSNQVKNIEGRYKPLLPRPPASPSVSDFFMEV